MSTKNVKLGRYVWKLQYKLIYFLEIINIIIYINVCIYYYIGIQKDPTKAVFFINVFKFVFWKKNHEDLQITF